MYISIFVHKGQLRWLNIRKHLLNLVKITSIIKTYSIVRLQIVSDTKYSIGCSTKSRNFHNLYQGASTVRYTKFKPWCCIYLSHYENVLMNILSLLYGNFLINTMSLYGNVKSRTSVTVWAPPSLMALLGKNQQLVADEPVEVRDFRRIADHYKESIEYISNEWKHQNREMCNM